MAKHSGTRIFIVIDRTVKTDLWEDIIPNWGTVKYGKWDRKYYI